MSNNLLIGITQKGTIHTDADPPISTDEMFRRVKESGAYDYMDKTPPEAEVGDYAKAAEKYDLPVLAGGWFYTLGRDEALLEKNLQIAQTLGSKVHNTQIMAAGADGHAVTNERVLEAYLRAYDFGMKLGVTPCFEVHVNMWSEDFRRVNEVAEMVHRRGVPFNMTLDHSHVIFKIDNPEEWDVFAVEDAQERARYSIRQAVESGELILDPFKPNNVCSQWIEANYPRHMHARAAVPAGPKNKWARHEDGRMGRGIQYPFIEPQPGQWHTEWDESRLEPWKEVVRQALQHHATHAESNLHQVSTEFIPNPDYGGGAKYSILENSIACARWIRQTWQQIQSRAA